MAARGSRKELSQRHEQYVADAYGGKRSDSSGGAVTDEGDVRVISDQTLFECKAKFGLLLGAVPVKSTMIGQFEKITDEAYSVGKEPGLALRFYCPESYLADNNGWVDLVVRLLGDDVVRSEALLSARECEEQGRCH